MVELISVHLVFLIKAIDLVALICKGTDNAYSRKVLLQNGGEFGLCFVGFLKGLFHFHKENNGKGEDDGHCDHRNHRHAQIGTKHDADDKRHHK